MYVYHVEWKQEFSMLVKRSWLRYIWRKALADSFYVRMNFGLILVHRKRNLFFNFCCSTLYLIFSRSEFLWLFYIYWNNKELFLKEIMFRFALGGQVKIIRKDWYRNEKGQRVSFTSAPPPPFLISLFPRARSHAPSFFPSIRALGEKTTATQEIKGTWSALSRYFKSFF